MGSRLATSCLTRTCQCKDDLHVLATSGKMINTCSLTSGKMINTCSLLPVNHEIHPSGPNALFISRQKLRPLRHVSKHSFFSGQIPVYSLGWRGGPPPPPKYYPLIYCSSRISDYRLAHLSYLIWPPSGRKKKKNHWQPCNLTKRCWDEMTLLLSYHRFRPLTVKGTVSWDFQPLKKLYLKVQAKLI